MSSTACVTTTWGAVSLVISRQLQVLAVHTALGLGVAFGVLRRLPVH